MHATEAPPAPKTPDTRRPRSEDNRWHRPLLVAGLLMALVALVSAVAIPLDHRTMMGESVWVKSLKFGLSFAAYLLTLAWLLGRLIRGRRFGWLFGTAFAVVSVAEVAVITLAAALGTYSHFNTADTLINQVVQATFKYGVPLMFGVNVVIAVLVLVQRIGDRAVTSAIRWGLLLSTLGMFAAFFIVSVGGQGRRVVDDANGNRVELNAGHGVGDLDGHGMFLTNWSTTGGDMRVAHFVGLHGIQVLIAVAVALSLLALRHEWLRDDGVRARLITFLAIGYLGVLITAGWQAVRGQSVIAPDAASLAAYAGSALLALAGVAVTIRQAYRVALPVGRVDT